jgi:hypothetical protein
MTGLDSRTTHDQLRSSSNAVAQLRNRPMGKASLRRLLSRMGSLRWHTIAFAIPVMLTVVACSTAAPPEATQDPIPFPTNAQKETGTNVGEFAPDFSVTTVTGEQLGLSSLTGNGSSVLLYFFASW